MHDQPSSSARLTRVRAAMHLDADPDAKPTAQQEAASAGEHVAHLTGVKPESPADSKAHHETLFALLHEVGRIRGCLEARASPSRQEPLLLTLYDVANLLAVSPRIVETLVAEGELRLLRIRGTCRFTREAVEAFHLSYAKPRRTTWRRSSCPILPRHT